MTRGNVAGGAVLALVLFPAVAWAQLSSSGIAGVVRDSSGAVLPGVTVEASSPALIEKVRSVVTDGQGQYNIVDLRIGTYVVTFSLPGFSIVRREGIVLTAGFTATVNAEMRVGSLEETITVTGASPLVDTRNTRQQTVVSDELLDLLPTSSKGMQVFSSVIPQMVAQADVGGSTGTFALQNNQSSGHGAATVASTHGKVGSKTMFDGMRISNLDGAGTTAGYIINAITVQEMLLETGGASAESNHAVTMNMVPKEGGNTYRGSFAGLFGNDKMQSDNLTDDLLARGLPSAPKYILNRDAGGTFGGPLKQDRLWFFTAHRWWGQSYQIAGVYHNKTQGTPFYTPDLNRPSEVSNPYRSNVFRLTWQASPRNKISVHADNQDGTNPWRPENKSPEAQAWMRYYPMGLYYVTWNSPRTSKLLFEAASSLAIAHYNNRARDGVTPDDIGIVELSTGLAYNAGTSPSCACSGGVGYNNADRYTQRGAVAYVTGTHAFKAGFQMETGIQETDVFVNHDVVYRFNRGVPSAIVQYAYPNIQKQTMKADLGIYAQDQWTFRRLTLNMGLRFDYLNTYVPEQHLAAGQFVPARDFDPVHAVPLWKDLNPRLGAAYDLFGTGKTALKVSVGRYVNIVATGLAATANPVRASVNEVTRTWGDADGDYVPDCELKNFSANGECGPVSNQNFGNLGITTRYANGVLEGFGVRPYFWDIAAEVQQELSPGISLNGGYFRVLHRQGSNTLTPSGGYVTDNLAVTPTDFDSYCITAPGDARLPGGGGYQICGLADVSPSKFGQVNNVVTRASDFGKQSETGDFVNVSFNARLRSGIRLIGGVDTGRIVRDNCYVVDSPQDLLYCRVVRPWSSNTQFKLSGAYPLPGDFAVSGVFQNVAGLPIAANYQAPNSLIAPSLGRNLAACGTRAVCTATAPIPLIAPYTKFENRRTQLDLRLTKFLKLGTRARLQANVDLYNALNTNTVLESNQNYGTRWLQPLQILQARVIQVSGTLNF